MTLTHVSTVLSKFLQLLIPFLTIFKCLFPLSLLFPAHLHPAFPQCAGRTRGGGERTPSLPPCCSRALPASRTSNLGRKASQTASVTSLSSGLWRGEHKHQHVHIVNTVVSYSSIFLLLHGMEIFFTNSLFAAAGSK